MPVLVYVMRYHFCLHRFLLLPRLGVQHWMLTICMCLLILFLSRVLSVPLDDVARSVLDPGDCYFLPAPVVPCATDRPAAADLGAVSLTSSARADVLPAPAPTPTLDHASQGSVSSSDRAQVSPGLLQPAAQSPGRPGSSVVRGETPALLWFLQVPLLRLRMLHLLLLLHLLLSHLMICGLGLVSRITLFNQKSCFPG